MSEDNNINENNSDLNFINEISNSIGQNENVVSQSVQNNEGINNHTTENNSPEAIQQTLTNNLQNLLREARDLRRNQNEENEGGFFSDLYEIIFSKSFLFISLFVQIIIFFSFHLILTENEFDISSLESDEMIVPYVLTFVTLLSFSWNCYLIIFMLTTNLENIIQDINHISNDIPKVYFNPLFFILIISSVNKKFITSSLDIFILLTISSEYALNLFFVNLHFSHFNRKIKSIMNFALFNNTYLMIKNRIGFLLMGLINITFSIFLYNIINETSIIYKYLVLFKVI